MAGKLFHFTKTQIKSSMNLPKKAIKACRRENVFHSCTKKKLFAILRPSVSALPCPFAGDTGLHRTEKIYCREQNAPEIAVALLVGG